MPDHYETLGVPRDADTATIKRAYRKKASKAHPDKGGDAASMALVNRAHEVLTDPDRRDRYDRTGADGETRPPADEASELLMSAFAAALEEPEGCFIEAVRAKVTGLVVEGQRSVRRLDSQIVKLTRRRDKTTGPERNLVHLVIDQQIKHASQERERIGEALKTAQRAVEMLGDYQSSELRESVFNWGTGATIRTR